ncbi:MAG: hypothetical protein KGI71_04745 [Patescibacteria group bacterium]|nr:hypothetical protein [Patescibacteria group bacterium]
MSPTSRVALSSGFGAALGAFGGFLVSWGLSAAVGAAPQTRTRETTVILGIAAGAVAGAAALSSYTEHKQLAAGSGA